MRTATSAAPLCVPAGTVTLRAVQRPPGEGREPTAHPGVQFTEIPGNPRRLRRRLCLSAGCQWRDIARHAALHRFNPFAVFEADQVARDNRARSCQAGKPLAHRCKRHAHLLGNFQIEPLTVFLQALQDFDHGGHLRKKER